MPENVQTQPNEQKPTPEELKAQERKEIINACYDIRKNCIFQPDEVAIYYRLFSAPEKEQAENAMLRLARERIVQKKDDMEKALKYLSEHDCSFHQEALETLKQCQDSCFAIQKEVMMNLNEEAVVATAKWQDSTDPYRTIRCQAAREAAKERGFHIPTI